MEVLWNNLIPRGEQNAIHLEELAGRMGVNPITAKKRIRRARIKGVEICSSRNGYFLPVDEAERRRYVHMQTRQALSRFLTCKKSREILGVLEYAEKHAGQLQFDLPEDPQQENDGGVEV